MSVLIFDGGNSLIKGKTPEREIAFTHALKRITEAEYQQKLDRAGRGGPDPDYVRVNGVPYAVGESAERHGTLTRLSGRARYSKDYTGVLVAATLARLYDRGGEMAVFASHPPGDVGWRDDLIGAVLGHWHVEISGGERHFRVTYANTFDEALGGLMHVLLTQDGEHYQRTDINGGPALVLDVGGLTTDFLDVAPGGKPLYSFPDPSTPIGINEAVRQFKRSLHSTYPALFKSGHAFPEQYRAALATGVFRGGGDDYPCENESREATSIVLNRIADEYQNIAGGPVRWDSIILTGGGSAMLYERLLPVLDHGRVVLAEGLDAAHLANVRGGLKLWRLWQSLGVA